MSLGLILMFVALIQMVMHVGLSVIPVSSACTAHLVVAVWCKLWLVECVLCEEQMEKMILNSS